MSFWNTAFSAGSLANQTRNTINTGYNNQTGSLLNSNGSIGQQQAAAYNHQLWQQQPTYNQQVWNNPVLKRNNWVFDGRSCTVTEFADLAYGDTPERTMFLLKHAGK